MFVTLRGEPYLLWRAVDEHGAELDGLVQKRRDKAARRFFRWVLRSTPAPRKIVTDKLHSYAAAKAEIPELANVKHVFVKAAARVNNRAENSHQPTRRRERQMCGFRGPKRTQAFLSSFGPIRQHCVLPRHRMSAARHRIGLKARFTAWQRWSMAESRINAFDWHAENTIGTIQPASTNLTVPSGRSSSGWGWTA
jgi:putative transposase